MNYNICIDTPEKRALDHCFGTMHKGQGCGFGYGDGNLRQRGGLFSGSGTCPKTWF